MQVKLDEGGYRKLSNSINFFKKRKNWNEILWTAMENVADEIRDDAEDKLYQKWNKNTGKAGKSIRTVLKREGNYTYISLASDHPAMNYLHYGGEVKNVPAYTEDFGTNLVPGNKYGGNYTKYWPSLSDKASQMKMSAAIYDNDPFTEGAFHMENALREGLPDLESEIMRTAHRMKPK